MFPDALKVKVESEEDRSESPPSRKKKGRKVNSSVPVLDPQHAERERSVDDPRSPVLKRESPDYDASQRQPWLIGLTSPEAPRRQGAEKKTPIPDPGPHGRRDPPVNKVSRSKFPSNEGRKHGRPEEDDINMDVEDIFLHHALKHLKVDNTGKLDMIVASNERATTNYYRCIDRAIDEVIKSVASGNERAQRAIQDTVAEGRAET